MSKFMIIFLTIFVLIYYYILKRYVNKVGLSSSNKLYLKIFLSLNMIGVVLYVFGRYQFELPRYIYYFSSASIGVLFIFFCTALIYDIMRVSLENGKFTQSRRDSYKKALDYIAPIAAISVSAKSLYNAVHPEIEDVLVNIKGLKQEYKIVQISDVHIGGLVDAKFISGIVQKINSLNGDIVVITGDLIDIDVEKEVDLVLKLKEIHSKYGVYFIVGNHEYYHGIDKIIRAMKSIGIRVLENENVYIGDDSNGFNLVGVYDTMGYKFNHHIPDIDKAMRGLKNSPTVLLAHKPEFIKEVKGGVDLMLSGHTHGGQIYPFKFLVRLKQPYISGLHKHDERLQVYVSKGTGFWGPPMRLGASSEITNITLKPL
ncbi:MAG: metallophosphoesterase [Campylobacterales bacterium]|nr:metallophosphoesterase [Campylobacterales bacterium]